MEGPVKIRFDEFGHSSVQMGIESCTSERPLHFGLGEFLMGGKPVETDKGVTMGFGGLDNPCSKVTVAAPEGIFSISNRAIYGLQSHPLLGEGGELHFYPLRSQFDVTSPAAVRHLVIPLCNFMSDFAQRHPSLDRHPLRIYPPPAVPPGLSQEDASIANGRAHQYNRLIIFEFNGELGFIEALPDYENREERLLTGRERRLVTAVSQASLRHLISRISKSGPCSTFFTC